jgi:hypothetical protein
MEVHTPVTVPADINPQAGYVPWVRPRPAPQPLFPAHRNTKA